MKTLMLHVDHDSSFDGRLQVALDIARRFGAHLTLVQPCLSQDFVAFDMAGGAHFVAQAYEMAEQSRDELKKRVETHMAKEDITWDWQMTDGPSKSAILAEASRLADLAIVSLDTGRAGASQPGRSLVGDLAITSRTPVLAVPYDQRNFRFGTAMVAYDGGPEASFAIRSSVSLLSACEHVKIAEVGSFEDDLPMADAADYLARYGIEARIEPFQKGLRTVEERLVGAARAMQADWVVMGAYGHSRWREALFGGVTHYMLAEIGIPVLLAH
jgi:nucleotide-binding universal stress UspA family protein